MTRHVKVQSLYPLALRVRSMTQTIVRLTLHKLAASFHLTSLLAPEQVTVRPTLPRPTNSTPSSGCLLRITTSCKKMVQLCAMIK